MRLSTGFRSALVLAAASTFARPAGADDGAKAIIEKAVRACGGAEKFSAFKVTRAAAKGVISAGGREIPFLRRSVIAQPDKFREVMILDLGGQTVMRTTVLNGGKGWTTTTDGVTELTGAALDDLKERPYVARVLNLAALLTEKTIIVTALGEGGAGENLVGVKVASSGHRDVRLWFHKDSGLPAKMETERSDPQGKSVVQESVFLEHKEFHGAKIANKIVIREGGRKVVELELSELELVSAPDEKEFAKPEK